MSGYLSRCKSGKRRWKKLWLVIKGKVLYTYLASEVHPFCSCYLREACVKYECGNRGWRNYQLGSPCICRHEFWILLGPLLVVFKSLG